MEDVVLVGSGGFAREVKFLIEDINMVNKRFNIIGLVSNENFGDDVDGLPILGSDQWLVSLKKKVSVVICIGDGNIREKVYKLLISNNNLVFPNIIHPKVIMSRDIKLGIGNIITAGSIITVNVIMKNFVICNLACTIGHDVVVNNYATLLPGAHISGNVVIGENTTIGTGASVLQNLVIGDNAYVGAGAVVTRNVLSAKTVIGVPAKELIK